MEKIKKLIYIFVFLILFILVGTIKSNAGDLNFNNLNFDVQINTDGSMDVTENWDIHIEDTNTLYKSFKTDSTKYSNITNVQVKEITNGRNKQFINTGVWQYHVSKDYYYGTNNEDGNFEIGWGVGLEDKTATRQYEISYKVNNVISKYNDYAQLYWQFIGEDFEIDADKITGKILLPSNVSNTDEIKVWGHTEGLNGTIYATDLNKIEFELDDFKSGRYVEIRTLFPTELITNSDKTENTNILDSVLSEEKKWADEANQKRKMNKIIKYIIAIGIILINLALVIIFLKKALKYRKKLKELKEIGKYKPSVEFDYYRELPDEKATPAESILITEGNYKAFTSNSLGKIFSATLLNLTLKGYLQIWQNENEKEKIKIKVIKDDEKEIKNDELCILKFIKMASLGKEEITIKELENYIKENSTKVEKLCKDVHKYAKEQTENNSNMDKEEEKEYSSYDGKAAEYIMSAIFIIIFATFLFVPVSIVLVIDAIYCIRIRNKINVLTQKGVDEKTEWNGLKKYMNDFSLLKEREVPELVIWEKFLVFATAFGIAEKVIKQLKIVYPNMDQMEGITTYAYMNLMINTNFASSFSNSINSSISSAYSSASGSGGGFSGGGGGGRRPEEAVEEDNQSSKTKT